METDKTNVDDDDKNMFTYVWENRRVELLRMIIENF